MFVSLFSVTCRATLLSFLVNSFHAERKEGGVAPQQEFCPNMLNNPRAFIGFFASTPELSSYPNLTMSTLSDSAQCPLVEGKMSKVSEVLVLVDKEHRFNFLFEDVLRKTHLFFRSGPGKPNQRKVSSRTFRRGILEQKFNVNRTCFPKEKRQNSQKWAKFMNFSFWPFLWFGSLGRLLIFDTDISKDYQALLASNYSSTAELLLCNLYY